MNEESFPVTPTRSGVMFDRGRGPSSAEAISDVELSRTFYDSHILVEEVGCPFRVRLIPSMSCDEMSESSLRSCSIAYNNPTDGKIRWLPTEANCRR